MGYLEVQSEHLCGSHGRENCLRLLQKKDLFLVYGSVSGPDGSVLDPDLIRSGGSVS